MPNATWREEKSEFVVKAICQTLESPDLPESVRSALEGEALFNALKLFADAVEERLGSTRGRWSPGLVDAFRNEPGKCDQLLGLMAEPAFSADGYWRK